MKKVQVYNSSESLVWEGTYSGLEELKKNHQINDSDRIVFNN